MYKDIIKNKYGFFEIKNKPSKKELQEYYAQKYFQEDKGCYESNYDKVNSHHKCTTKFN